MSRSNPNESLRHVATRWFEWSSKSKCIKWYDKENKKNNLVKLPFTFLLLDELSLMRGYNKKKSDGITSNEVRNTKTDTMTVRFFKNGLIASGLYEMIKEKVNYMQGSYHINAYIAYVGDDKKLAIGSLMLGGCSMSAWIDFRNACRKKPLIEIDGKKVEAHYAKAVSITGTKEGTVGDIEFSSPVFQLQEVKPETANAAFELDKELQAFLAVYLAKKQPSPPSGEHDQTYQPTPEDDGNQADPEEKEPEPEPEQAPEGGDIDVPF